MSVDYVFEHVLHIIIPMARFNDFNYMQYCETCMEFIVVDLLGCGLSIRTKECADVLDMKCNIRINFFI